MCAVATKADYCYLVADNLSFAVPCRSRSDALNHAYKARPTDDVNRTVCYRIMSRDAETRATTRSGYER